MLITSVNNNHIKEIIKLKDKKYRDECNKFLVDTKHLVMEAYKENLIEELILYKDERMVYKTIQKISSGTLRLYRRKVNSIGGEEQTYVYKRIK